MFSSSLYSPEYPLDTVPRSPVFHVLYVLHCSQAQISNVTQLASIPHSPALHVLCFPPFSRTNFKCNLDSILRRSPVLYILSSTPTG